MTPPKPILRLTKTRIFKAWKLQIDGVDKFEGEELKTIGARWNARQLVWEMPPIHASIKSLERLWGVNSFDKDYDVQQMYDSPYGFELANLANIRNAVIVDPEKWNLLYGYQKEAIQYLLSTPYGGAILELGPGLGKTPTALIAASKFDRVLVVSMKSLMMNWVREIRDWIGLQANLCYHRKPTPAGWVVTNFDTVTGFFSDYDQPWDVIILDESLLVKNNDTSRHKRLMKIRQKSGSIWLLSGSPTSKYADDLYAQFELIYPQAFTSYWRFAHTYCYVEETKWGSKVIGTRRNIDLVDEFKDLRFVRTKEQELPDLPEFLYETVSVEMLPEQAEIYRQLKEEFITRLDSGEEITVVNKAAQLIRLQEVVSNPANLGPDWPNISGKSDVLIDLLRNNRVPLPAIIWVHWTRGAQLLADRIQKEAKLSVGLATGKTKDPDAVISAFKGSKLDVLLLSLQAGKYGHTLVNAKSLVYFDKTWDADAYVQSPARVQRIGLKHRPLIITLRCIKTTDTLIERNLKSKVNSIAHLSNQRLSSILRSL